MKKNHSILKFALYVFLFAFCRVSIAQTGQVDPTFNPSDIGFGNGDGANTGEVKCFAIQNDGKIIIGGGFNTFNNNNASQIVRVNPDGSIDPNFNTGTGFNLWNSLTSIAIQTDGKIIVGGGFTTYNGITRKGIARLNSDGSLDTYFNNGAGCGPINALAIQSDGKIVIGGAFDSYDGIPVNRIARLNPDGTLDAGFNIGTGFDAGGGVGSIAIQSDGKIIVGGWFLSYNGTPQNRLSRLNTDGSLDTSFDVGMGGNGGVNSIAIQTDGKIIVVGDFSSYNGFTRRYITRLLTDGSVDTGFDPGIGADNTVNTCAIQSDGKILIAGSIFHYAGITRVGIARLNADATLDSSFDPINGSDGAIPAIAIQNDGKIIIGGSFIKYNGIQKNRVARINSDGSLDVGFNKGNAANGFVQSSAIQSDGKIIIGGDFTSYFGTDANRVARVNTDGSLDLGFNAGAGANAAIYSISVQTDGKIIVGGGFWNFNNTYAGYITRMNADGSLDAGFNTGGYGANSYVYTTALQNDGKIIIGGIFYQYNGIAGKGLRRLNSDGSIDYSFNTGTGIPYGGIWTSFIQSDGKIVIGGDFPSYNGTPIQHIARINSDGSLDASFNPIVNGQVYSSVLQSDGKIIIAGIFSSVNGTARNKIARLNTDGSLDVSFNPGTGVSGYLYNVNVQNDGKIFIAGEFNAYNGIAKNNIARLMPDGSVDADFNTTANQLVYTTSIQGDGKIIVGGELTSINGTGRNRIARIYGSVNPCLDTDLDGIADNIDTQPAVFSNNFSDVPLGGTSLGLITNRGGRTWQICDAPNPDGMNVDVASGPLVAGVKICGFVNLSIPANIASNFVVTCSSGITQVLSGTVIASAAVGVNDEVVAVIAAGNKLKYHEIDAYSMEVYSYPSSASTITYTFKGNTFSITPGSRDTLTACNLSSGIAVTEVNCNVGNSTTATVSVLGGVGTLTYLWNNGQTTSTCTQMSPGLYNVIVTDGIGCQITDSVVITEPVKCGNNNEKIVVCQIKGGNPRTMCVDPHAVQALLAQGAYCGPCAQRSADNGIEDENISGVEIYPNPVSDVLVLQGTVNGTTVSVKIYNMMGQVIYTGSVTDKTNVDVSGFNPKGIYFIQLTSPGNYSEFRKIIVN
jgi:uncharacterized delta-60 repeat protein